MNISIVCVGRMKEAYLVDGIKEYAKRLTRYCKLEIIEVPDEKAPENLSPKEMEQIKDREGERILEKIRDSAYVVALAIQGKSLSSEAFAGFMEKLTVDGRSELVFVIGGSLGLSDDVMKRSDYSLSFSKMTFPHQMMRLFLVEQIYRGFRILKNEPYHK